MKWEFEHKLDKNNSFRHLIHGEQASIGYIAVVIVCRPQSTVVLLVTLWFVGAQSVSSHRFYFSLIFRLNAIRKWDIFRRSVLCPPLSLPYLMDVNYKVARLTQTHTEWLLLGLELQHLLSTGIHYPPRLMVGGSRIMRCWTDEEIKRHYPCRWWDSKYALNRKLHICAACKYIVRPRHWYVWQQNYGENGCSSLTQYAPKWQLLTLHDALEIHIANTNGDMRNGSRLCIGNRIV